MRSEGILCNYYQAFSRIQSRIAAELGYCYGAAGSIDLDCKFSRCGISGTSWVTRVNRAICIEVLTSHCFGG